MHAIGTGISSEKKKEEQTKSIDDNKFQKHIYHFVASPTFQKKSQNQYFPKPNPKRRPIDLYTLCRLYKRAGINIHQLIHQLNYASFADSKLILKNLCSELIQLPESFGTNLGDFRIHLLIKNSESLVFNACGCVCSWNIFTNS